MNVENLLYQAGIGMEAARLRARAGGIAGKECRLGKSLYYESVYYVVNRNY